MEFVEDGSVLSVLEKSNIEFTFLEQVSFCAQLASGLFHLHQEGVIHADLSLRNCLIELKTKRIAISDFGLSQCETRPRKVDAVAIRWASPELVKTRIPTKKSDVWALGTT